ncbi:MAG TPA: helix-turn-helix transcriptional regulator [Candidatus Dormibacteraeota bacterium]
MTDEELERRVLGLRAQGRSPKEIAQALGVRPATVAALIRTIAGRDAVAAPEAAVVGCWVSPGWREGLTVDGHPDWPDGEEATPSAAGLVSVLVARAHRYGKVTVCGYLVDAYCLGVKDVLGPRAIAGRELTGFVERYFQAYQSPPLPAPIDLARHLAWGAVEYARGLGFEPAQSFDAAAAGHLGPLTETSAIRFGRNGKPLFVQGPDDDAARILRTLESTAGSGNFDVVVGPARESRPGAAPATRLGRTAGGMRAPGDVVQEGRQWRTRNR